MAINEKSILGQMTSTETICDWYTFCLEVCCEIVSRRDGPIGRPSTIVEIDQGKFCRCKYNRKDSLMASGFSASIVEKPRRIYCFSTKTGQKRADIDDSRKPFCFERLISLIDFADPVTCAIIQNVESQWWQILRNLPDTHTPLSFTSVFGWIPFQHVVTS
ncbi:hypothetical protein RF11_11827 [Thelohanellus kitauei]|uniref:Uncharacterized protein n=1 Tax=Thelohanellus kitauei TaxID=669202 RepID=A0A0C2J690_THEKT|nr:hypothetical protein RF11_01585 [Thelohanellus kitauei]KII70491.1 hypothetical protein RF11_11827 [Thelohanellus kitauei]